MKTMPVQRESIEKAADEAVFQKNPVLSDLVALSAAQKVLSGGRACGDDQRAMAGKLIDQAQMISRLSEAMEVLLGEVDALRRERTFLRGERTKLRNRLEGAAGNRGGAR